MKKALAVAGIGAALIAGPLVACGSAGATPTNDGVCDVIESKLPGSIRYETYMAAVLAVEDKYDVSLDKADAIAKASIKKYCPEYTYTYQ